MKAASWLSRILSHSQLSNSARFRIGPAVTLPDFRGRSPSATRLRVGPFSALAEQETTTHGMKLYWNLKAEHAARFFARGEMYFGHCSRYADSQLNDAQRDIESARIATFSRGEIRIRSGPDPERTVEVPFESVTFQSDLPIYFLRSMSLEFSRETMEGLGADAVVEIFDVSRLVEAIEFAVSTQLSTGVWRLVRKPVRYVSKHELIQIHDLLERIFAKDREDYGSQDEFRLVLVPEHNFPGKNDPHVLLYLDEVISFARKVG